MRIAVLGAGSHSRSSHGTPLRRCCQESGGKAELTAVCDLDGERAAAYARDFGFARTHTDLTALVSQERPDGIVAVTPIPATGAVARQIASLGVPLVVEKPPGATLAEAESLAAAVLRTGVPHMVSFNRRFNPAVRRALDFLAGREPPQLVIGRMLRHGRQDETFAFGTGIHLVDTVLAVMGAPAAVCAAAVPVGPHQVPFFDARLTFHGGGAAQLAIAPACGRTEETLEVIGPDYDIQVDVGEPAIVVHQNGVQTMAWAASAAMAADERSGALDEARAFLRYLETGGGWWPTLADALWSVRVSQAIQDGASQAWPA